MSASQLMHRVSLRSKLAMERRIPIMQRRYRSSTEPTSFWPNDFVSVDQKAWGDARSSLSDDGSLVILNQTLHPMAQGFSGSSLPQLVSFHLHYWDWAWQLQHLSQPERLELFATMFRCWEGSSSFPQGDAWAPYVASLRAWSWCCQFNTMITDGPVDIEVRRQLALHLRFIRGHLERDVGGNHLIKNLKAWIGLSVFFGNSHDVTRAMQMLNRELNRQILPDGGHFERSPAYHVQVLADLIDIQQLMIASGYGENTPRLTQSIEAMRVCLGVIQDPRGQVFLMNDGFPVLDQIIQATTPPGSHIGSAHLSNMGYARLAQGDWLAFVDVGDPCPDSLPAHAQADTLGCIIYYRNQRVISEAFTSVYESGEMRKYERSTAAHSTIQLAGTDSTEVWAAFRAGRRARIRDVEFRDGSNEDVSVAAWHDGYRHLPGRPKHHRRVTCATDGITVIDTLTASSPTDFLLRWHLDDPYVEHCSGDLLRLGESLSMHIGGPVDVRLARGSQAVGFDNCREISVVEARGRAFGIIEITTRIEEWKDGGLP